MATLPVEIELLVEAQGGGGVSLRCLFCLPVACFSAVLPPPPPARPPPPLFIPKKGKAYPNALRMFAAYVPPGGFSGQVRSCSILCPLVL